MEINTGRHCVFELKVHLVFIPKYRRDVFTSRVLNQLQVIFKDTCLKLESELIEFNGESNHVHLLVSFPPKLSISKLVNSLKGVSSRLIRKFHYPEVQSKLWGSHFWSPSYYVGSSGGVTIEKIRQYIEAQNRPSITALKGNVLPPER